MGCSEAQGRLALLIRLLKYAKSDLEDVRAILGRDGIIFYENCPRAMEPHRKGHEVAAPNTGPISDEPMCSLNE